MLLKACKGEIYYTEIHHLGEFLNEICMMIYRATTLET